MSAEHTFTQTFNGGGVWVLCPQQLNIGLLLLVLSPASVITGEARGALFIPNLFFRWVPPHGVAASPRDAAGLAAVRQSVKELFPAALRSSLQIPLLLQLLTSSCSLNYTGASQEERKKKGEISPCLLRRASLSPREGRKAALQISLIW